MSARIDELGSDELLREAAAKLVPSVEASLRAESVETAKEADARLREEIEALSGLCQCVDCSEARRQMMRCKICRACATSLRSGRHTHLCIRCVERCS